MTKQEKAIELHDRGCNCAQAVACAFAEEIGVPVGHSLPEVGALVV